MSTISEQLRVTLLSLKQISDRIKSLITTSATKSELSTAKQEVIDAIDEIDIDTSDLAKEDTLTQGISNIREDISNIDIDTSDLAKQGTNPNATLSEVQTLIGYTIQEIDGV